MAARRSQRGLGAIDTLVVCTIVGLLIVVFFSYEERLVQEAKEVALRSGLQNIRTSINLYRAYHGNSNPESLKILVEAKVLAPNRAGEQSAAPYLIQTSLLEKVYLDAYAVDEEGYPIDPFGNRYNYDPKSGDVASRTSGYETW